MHAVERGPAAQRPGDVAERLGDEQHADRAERRTGAIAELAEGRAQDADGEADHQERGEVQRGWIDRDRRGGMGYGMHRGALWHAARYVRPMAGSPNETVHDMTRDTNHNTHADSIHGSIHGSVLGTRVVRTEDPGLLTGQRKYVADLQLEGTVQAVFVRSGVAHGTIKAIHIEDAVGMPGVVAVWTATELGVAPHHGFMKVHDDFARPPLAVDRVRFVGEAIAVVFAETYEQGEDAAGAVWAEIDTLPPIIDPETAFDDDAILIFPDHGRTRR